MRERNRRHFLHDTAALAAAIAALPAGRALAEPEDAPAPDTAKRSANETIRVAVVGVKGRGMDHVDGFSRQPNVKVAAICDIDENVIGPAKQHLEKLDPKSPPKYYQDIRKLLEDKDIDVVSIATPNHWHALAAIWACQAGKDVYVEKPVSHNVTEGRRIVDAARHYKRIVQTGTQCRSHKAVIDAVAFLRSGKLGKVYMAKGLCYKPRGSIGHKPDGPVPAGVDFNVWLGPAPERPFNPNRFHYNWHWFWDTGNGDLGNQGIHQMDLARWGIAKNEFPKTVMSSGGRFGYEDDGETPNTLSTFFEFDDVELQFEVRGLITNPEQEVKIGNIFYGTEGILTIDGYNTFRTYFGPKLEPGESGKGGGDHYANFLQAVRARDPKILNADIEEGHLSSAYCHLGNIAYRLGRKLHINPASESFVDDSEADAMLTRPYRAPFVVPAKIG
ncbi:Gfo/Idh/MocA family protein [Paludisphaera mucosa]|uniref:Gfo/Idh/MocA family oxidoreductase n=1 Tax=Paludisphaera mucosa TaxID=3030827 RepID=A0ABT6FAQ6_9BACT|nr:Gfo/Idh/MocA family oxidoreductase [Paludisphaera mucosa]MDG3004673.1 Gfo/Idh/MocA family oxidoreductase [Paludisphaera mucosa]